MQSAVAKAGGDVPPVRDEDNEEGVLEQRIAR